MRPLPTLLLAALLAALSGCQAPPPPRVVTHATFKVQTALLLTSEDGRLTADQLAARRDDIVRYLTARGLLSADDILVNNAAAADRLIRVSIAADDTYKVTIFNPGSTGAYYSPLPTPLPHSSTYQSPYYDPFFDFGYYYSPFPEFGYYPYLPRSLPRPRYPHDYQPPPEPRRSPPPPVVVKPQPPPSPRPDRPHGDYRPHRPNDDISSRPLPPPATRDREGRKPAPTPEPRRQPDRDHDDDRRDYPQPPR